MATTTLRRTADHDDLNDHAIAGIRGDDPTRASDLDLDISRDDPDNRDDRDSTDDGNSDDDDSDDAGTRWLPQVNEATASATAGTLATAPPVTTRTFEHSYYYKDDAPLVFARKGTEWTFSRAGEDTDGPLYRITGKRELNVGEPRCGAEGA